MTVPLNLYVSITGADTNNGLTWATAMRTIAAVTQLAQQTPNYGGGTVINLGAGTWVESVSITGAPPYSGTTASNYPFITYAGMPYSSGSPTTQWVNNPAGNAVLVVNGGAVVAVQNLYMGNDTSALPVLLFAQLGGVIHVGPGMLFGPAAQDFHVENGSRIHIWNSYSKLGGAYTQNAHAAAIDSGSQIRWEGPMTVTLNGPPMPNFSDAFLCASNNATLYLATGIIWNGGYIGSSRFDITKGARLDSQGNGLLSIPGIGGNQTPDGGVY